MEGAIKDWRNDIYKVFKELDITMVSHVPDAGHTPLINLCEKDNEIDVVTLTTEQDGVAYRVGRTLEEEKVYYLCNQVGWELSLIHI